MLTTAFPHSYVLKHATQFKDHVLLPADFFLDYLQLYKLFFQFTSIFYSGLSKFARLISKIVSLEFEWFKSLKGQLFHRSVEYRKCFLHIPFPRLSVLQWLLSDCPQSQLSNKVNDSLIMKFLYERRFTLSLMDFTTMPSA